MGKIRYLIVGIDPGTTTAFAALDLDGNLISISGSKEYGESVLLEELRKIGKTIVVATDKEKVPNFVKRISSRIKARIFVPDHDLGVKEKKELVLDQNFIGHKRDSLAAARFAYNFYEPLFKKIDASVPLKSRNEVKKKLLLEEAINIHDAVKERKKKVVELKKRRERSDGQGLSELKRDNFMLRRKIKDLEEEIRNLKSLPRGEIRRDTLSENRLRTIRQMSREMDILKRELDSTKKKNKILSSGGLPVGDEILISGKKIVVGEGKKREVIYINPEDIRTSKMEGIEYVRVKDVEKIIAKKIVRGLISEYRDKHH